jgi:hypothetical protein
MGIILPTPLGQLFCGLPLGGGLHRLQTFFFAAAKNDQFMSRCALALDPQVARMRHLAFMDAGDYCGVEREGNNDGSTMEGELAKLRGQEVEASMHQPASQREANGRKGISKQRRQRCDMRRRDNQLANKRQAGGKAPPLPCKPMVGFRQDSDRTRQKGTDRKDLESSKHHNTL